MDHALTVPRVITSTLIAAALLALGSPALGLSCGDMVTTSTTLTADLTGCAGNGLVVDADNITIDLAGFKIAAAGGNTSSGITDGATSRPGAQILNGTITGFQSGINLAASVRSVVEGMRVIANGTGTAVGVGDGSIVRNNLVDGNGGPGIAAGAGALVTGNAAFGNGGAAITVGVGGLVSGNAAKLNSGAGISAGNGSTVRANTATGNNSGISVGLHSRVNDNTTSLNLGNGISTGINATVNENTSSGNGGIGIAVVCPSLLIGNGSRSNGGGNLVETGDARCKKFNNMF